MNQTDSPALQKRNSFFCPTEPFAVSDGSRIIFANDENYLHLLTKKGIAGMVSESFCIDGRDYSVITTKDRKHFALILAETLTSVASGDQMSEPYAYRFLYQKSRMILTSELSGHLHFHEADIPMTAAVPCGVAYAFALFLIIYRIITQNPSTVLDILLELDDDEVTTVIHPASQVDSSLLFDNGFLSTLLSAILRNADIKLSSKETPHGECIRLTTKRLYKAAFTRFSAAEEGRLDRLFALVATFFGSVHEEGQGDS